MKVITKDIVVNSDGENDMIDLTTPSSKVIQETKLQDGNITIFVVGSTAAVTTIEYEPGLRADFPKMLSRIVPKNIEYEHNKTWHDGNGHSHIRASIVGPSLTIPFKKNTLLLGIWQHIVLIEMDTRKRERQVIMQVIGE